MQSDYFKPTAYKLSVDEADPIHQWKLRSANLMSKPQDSKKEDLIQKILNENDEKDEKPPQKPEKKTEVLAQITGSSSKDFEAFISKSKDVLNNMKVFNETVKKSELNIEILTAKTNLQNRLNELTLNRDFRNEEREQLKTRLSQIADLENEIAKKNSTVNSDKKRYNPQENSGTSLKNIDKDKQNSKKQSEDTHNDPYKIEVTGASETRISDTKKPEEPPVERESRISLTSFIDNKKGIANMNKLFNQELETHERKGTDYGAWNLNDHNMTTPDGKKIKNSRKLYELRFKKYAENLSFKEKPVIVLKLADQLYQCYSCHRSIKKSFFFFWNTARYCHYSGFWHCVDCISIEKKPIPYKALEDFDLRSYSISLDSQKEMNLLYEKPILLLDYKNPIVQKNTVLYDFLILKRQIHLIYDMICNPGLVQELMQDRINLVLKENLFSLENLLEIYNGALTKLITKYITLLTRHVDQCQECQQKGVYCKLCNSEKKIFVFDLVNTSLCPNCKRLYHTQCLQSKVCIYCVHDT